MSNIPTAKVCFQIEKGLLFTSINLISRLSSLTVATNSLLSVMVPLEVITDKKKSITQARLL